MDPFTWKTNVLGFCIASLLAWRSIRKKSLSRNGAIVGWIVGFVIVNTGLRGMVLFYFYQIGSWATKYKQTQKSQFDSTMVTTSCRGPTQVLAVSIVAVFLSLYHAVYYGPERPISFNTNDVSAVSGASHLTCAILAHHATGLADTLASEMGILTKQQQPVLITQPWRTVPPGTNGGVTMVGFIWSAIGGVLIGFLTVGMDYLSGLSPLHIMSVTLYGGICGLIGSIIDSILGATIQITYYDVENRKILSSRFENKPAGKIQHICSIDVISNEQVNFLSMAMTSWIGGWIIGPWWFST